MKFSSKNTNFLVHIQATCGMGVLVLRDWCQAGWYLTNVFWSHNFLLDLPALLFWKGMSIFDRNIGCFLALRECLSSGQLTSSKEKIWPTDEFKRINVIHCAQCSWPDVRKKFPVSFQARCKKNSKEKIPRNVMSSVFVTMKCIFVNIYQSFWPITLPKYILIMN